MVKKSFTIPVGLMAVCLLFGGARAAAQTTDVTVALVPMAAASASDSAAALPAAQTTFPVGSNMVVEVWAQTQSPAGLSQVSIDLNYSPTAFTVLSVTHTATFSLFAGDTVNNAVGLVDDLSGSVPPAAPACGGQVGAAPQWARVAVIDLQANTLGTENLVAGPSNSAVLVNANCGLLSPPAVSFQNATVTIEAAGPLVPAVLTWGLLVMTILSLVIGSVRIRQSRSYSLVE